MFMLRFTTDCHPFSKNGQPPHRITGVERINSPQESAFGETKRSTACGKAISLIPAITTTAMITALTQNRRFISANSRLSSSAAGMRGSRFIPQIGQLPGACRTISGCIGQVYSTPEREGGGEDDED